MAASSGNARPAKVDLLAKAARQAEPVSLGRIVAGRLDQTDRMSSYASVVLSDREAQSSNRPVGHTADTPPMSSNFESRLR